MVYFLIFLFNSSSSNLNVSNMLKILCYSDENDALSPLENVAIALAIFGIVLLLIILVEVLTIVHKYGSMRWNQVF